MPILVPLVFILYDLQLENKRYRNPMRQSIMENPEVEATLDTKQRTKTKNREQRQKTQHSKLKR